MSTGEEKCCVCDKPAVHYNWHRRWHTGEIDIVTVCHDCSLDDSGDPKCWTFLENDTSTTDR